MPARVSACDHAGYGGNGTSPSMNSSRSRPSAPIPSGRDAPSKPAARQADEKLVNDDRVRVRRTEHDIAGTRHAPRVRNPAGELFLVRHSPVIPSSSSRVVLA